MSFWEKQQQQASSELASVAADVGRAWIDKRRRDRIEGEHEAQLKVAYRRALENAKHTGEMPVEFQEQIPIDWIIGQIGVKAVALRELAKIVPDHPLVKSQMVRDLITQMTRIKFNRLNRNSEADVNHYVPDDLECQKTFKTCTESGKR